jgi:D-arabinose 1-dehydrogenase-like Zn-dependent alcohol dehydrogenase
MRAVFASPDRWTIQNIPDPDPGPDQVLVRVHASGVCRNDLHKREGIPGHEPAGEIVAVGAAVRDRKVGDRVGVMLWQSSCGRCEWCGRGKMLFCEGAVGTSLGAPGSHADLMVAPAKATVLLPDALSFEQAASLFCAGYTAYAGLRAANPRPGDRIAVVGVGGIGHIAVQYAKASGFDTVALSRNPAKDALIRSLGADEILRDGEALRLAGGADVILGTAASAMAQADALAGLRPEGRFVVMGMDTVPIPVPIGSLIIKRATIIGSQHNDPAHLHEALAIAARGRVRVATETYPLEEAETVRRRLMTGDIRFRAVFTP